MKVLLLNNTDLYFGGAFYNFNEFETRNRICSSHVMRFSRSNFNLTPSPPATNWTEFANGVTGYPDIMKASQDQQYLYVGGDIERFGNTSAIRGAIYTNGNFRSFSTLPPSGSEAAWEGNNLILAGFSGGLLKYNASTGSSGTFQSIDPSLSGAIYAMARNSSSGWIYIGNKKKFLNWFFFFV